MGITADRVSAVLVTRGDVPLDEILGSLEGFDEIVIWDNSKRPQNLAVFGRYKAIEEARNDVIYVQDDDCIVPCEDILPHYTPGRLLANMDRERWGPNWGYPDSTLVGWGSVFDRELPEKAFDIFEEKSGITTFFAEAPTFKREVLPSGVIQQSNSPHRHWEPGRGWMTNEEFWRTCDVIFSSLTPRTVIDVGFRHLPWATAPNRMWTGDPNHSKERDGVLNLCRKIRTWPDDDVRIP